MRRLLGGLILGLIAASAAAQPRGTLTPDLVRQIRFTIAEFRIEGNTLVPTDELQAELKPLLGSSKTVEDLGAARRAVAEAYRRKGYELLTVDLDAARGRGGVHYLVVHEVRIGKVRVTGLRQLSEESIRAQLPSLREGETPRLGQLARELFLFNDNAARNAALEYARGGPGVTDVEVKVAEQPQRRLALIYNNTGTAATGTTRVGLQGTHADFLGRGHQVAGSVTTSDRPERVLLAGFSYAVPLPALGDQLAFNALYSDVDSGRVAEIFNVSGKGTIWGAHYLRNLARSAESRHVLDLGYDERRYRDVLDFFGTNLGASVTAKPLSLGYRYSRVAGREAVAAGVVMQQNVRGGARNDDAAYTAARAGAGARWQSWQMDAAWQRELASGWMPAARIAGQYTGEPLISAEQFGLGGIRAVRGFREREGAGDRGWRANLELHGPRFGAGQRLLGFVDFGNSRRLNPQPGELSGEGVSSYGVGWRGQFANGLQAAVDVAKVANGTPRQPSGDWMLHVTAVWSF